jgi:hypothetical protein
VTPSPKVKQITRKSAKVGHADPCCFIAIGRVVTSSDIYYCMPSVWAKFGGRTSVLDGSPRRSIAYGGTVDIFSRRIRRFINCLLAVFDGLSVGPEAGCRSSRRRVFRFESICCNLWLSLLLGLAYRVSTRTDMAK